jgi:hypothetical protein
MVTVEIFIKNPCAAKFTCAAKFKNYKIKFEEFFLNDCK